MKDKPVVKCPSCGENVTITWSGDGSPKQIVDKAARDLKRAINRVNRRLR